MDPCFEIFVKKGYKCENKYAVTFTLKGPPTLFVKPTSEQINEFNTALIVRNEQPRSQHVESIRQYH